MRTARTGVAAVLLAAAAALGTACGHSANGLPAVSAGKLRVVAAENFWGSIAAQLGGTRAAVSSVVVSPEADPHSYEATAGDGVTMAQSQLAIVNGIGYDPWASKLLAADPSSSRVVLDVGKLLGLGQGENPHQWYSPASVRRVIGAIVAGYERLDPAGRSYFEGRRAALERTGLTEYDRLRAEIRRRFAGVPVGYSESIFQPLGEDLGLRLMTPDGFAKAISEGTDVSAADKRTVDAQAEDGAIRVWVFNRQNTTPDVQRVNQLARGRHIPTATITETLSPASASFEQWQSAQLRALVAALHEATGR